MDKILPDDKRKQLDGLVQKMTTNKESDSYIQGVVNDFKGMYSIPSKPVEPAKTSDNVGNFISSQSSFKKQNTAVKAGEKSAVGAAFSGAPLFPAGKSDVNAGDKGFNPIKIAGKTLGNVVSDLPSIVSGMVNMVVHPIDSAKGMIEYYSNIAGETFGAIREGLKTGDYSRIEQDLQKATVSMIDHPLQTIAAIEGAKGGAEALKNPMEFAKKTTEGVTKGLDKGKEVFANAKANLKASGLNFMTDSSLHKRTVEVADTIGHQIDTQKKVTDLQKELDNMSKKTTEKVSAKEGDIQAKKTQQIQKELELQKAKSELADVGKIQKEYVKKASEETMSEAAGKGFPSLKEMQTSVSDFFGSIKDKLGKSYEDNLGNAPIKLDGFFTGMDKMQTYLKSISDSKTIKALNPILENLKLRDMVTKYSGDEKGFFNEMAKKGIDPEFSSLAEYQKEYPAMTSENFKGTRNVIKETIKSNNMDALKMYDKTITPELKTSFREAIKSEYGDATLKNLDETDKAWTDLMSNPLVGKESPTLLDIQKNWDAFNKNAEQIPEGQKMIEKLQNYTTEQILKNAQKPDGSFNVNTINEGVKKFGNVLGDESKAKLEGVVNLHNVLGSTIESSKGIVESKKGEVSSTKIDLKKLEEEQKQIKSDSKSVGENPDAVIKNIKSIKSIKELNDFVSKSGQDIEGIRKVIIQAIIEKADPKLLEDKNVPFDVNKTGEVIKQLEEIGKSEDGVEYKKVNNRIIGEDGMKALKELKAKYEEYQKLKTASSKSAAGRMMKGVFGAILLAMGHTLWGGLEVVRAATGGKKNIEELSGRERTTGIKPKKEKPPVNIFSKKNVLGGINAASFKKDNPQDDSS